jgi:trk system potassium uptake protein TrkH
MNPKSSVNHVEKILGFIADILAPSLQVQISLFFGFLVCLPVSYFYQSQNRPDLVPENPNLIWIGLGLSLTCYLIGNLLYQLLDISKHISLRRGAWIVFVSWFFACSISAVLYFMAGFPDPINADSMSIGRRVVDSYYESVSGFGTAGTSILKSVEIFPKSLLLWRTLTQWIGSMGIAYLAITIIKKFSVSRSEIINSEVETPNQIEFHSDEDARQSGWRFLIVYGYFSMVAFALLYISGAYFRLESYSHWYDNFFDSLNFALSAVSTGGFAVYDSSVGLSTYGAGSQIIGGLQNPVSEWILAIFMLLGGTSFVLWYGALFERKLKKLWQNLELKSYLSFIIIVTGILWYILAQNHTYYDIFENLRYAFFSVVTIVSTTGLVNQDFTQWPIQAQGLLFSCYLVGGCVGSTAGGLKFNRFLVMFKYAYIQTRNLIFGKNQTNFTLDGVLYGERSAGIILLNMILYFLIFLAGTVILLLSSSSITLPNGMIQSLNLEAAFTATIANLGGIGPAAFSSVAQAGPVGNYYAFSSLGKIIMMVLIFIGRIGVLSILMLFITQRGQRQLYNSTPTTDLDSDRVLLQMEI